MSRKGNSRFITGSANLEWHSDNVQKYAKSEWQFYPVMSEVQMNPIKNPYNLENVKQN